MSKKFEPSWRESAPAEKSYRSIFKWGDPNEYKHPNAGLYAMLKESFELSDDDFQHRKQEGDEPVVVKQKVKLNKKHIAKMESLVGKDNVATDDYSRLKYSAGKTMEETIQLRDKGLAHIADLVVHPRNKTDIQKIIAYCHKEKVPVTVYGGGSSVTLGLAPVKGGIVLVMQTWMNRFLAIDEDNQTVTVEAGMMGPALEEILNDAPERLGAERRYTCGHFPQSFEYSSVGGWIVTLGSGQQSSYYGDAYDMVLSQEYITPAGTIVTRDYPATATGPKLNDIFKGSEGSLGILVEVTIKVFRYMPENAQKFAWMFPSWEAAVNAAREISQGEFGMPSVFRISDQEETDIAMRLYGISGTPIDAMLKIRGFKPMERSLFIGQADGEKGFAKNVKKNVKRIAKKYGAMNLTGYPVTKWEHGRYRDPYMREDLHDYGIIIDTLETSVTWSTLHHIHQGVRKYIKKRKGTICMTHGSHFYSQGTNLYFIFIGKYKNLKDYKKFQEGVIDAIEKHGGSLSHHHGVGKMIGPWMERHLGKEQVNVLRVLKRHFDPHSILNPGGTLGLDLKAGETRK